MSKIQSNAINLKAIRDSSHTTIEQYHLSSVTIKQESPESETKLNKKQSQIKQKQTTNNNKNPPKQIYISSRAMP